MSQPRDEEERMVQVRGSENALLFRLDPKTMTIEVKNHGVYHEIRVHDLIAFAQTSQRIVFRADVIYPENSEGDEVVTSGKFE